MKNKYLKKGLWTSSAICLVIVALVAVNVFISNKDYSVDVTENKIYTLSDSTNKILDALDQEVVIYIINNKEDMTKEYKRIFNQYAKASDHIKLVYKDPELYPNFTKDYVDDDEVSDDSAIVVCGSKYRYLSSDDYVSYSYTGYSSTADSLQLETLVTQAIDYVVSDGTPIIYTLTGHEEADLESQITSGLEGDNYEVKELSLLTEDSVPDDCAVLMINGANKDLSKDEITKIKKYLKDDGKLYVLLGQNADDTPRLNSLLETYNVEVEKGMVAETDANMYYQYPVYILPTIQYSDSTEAQYDQNIYILLPGSKGLTIKEDEDEDEDSEYTVSELLTTSDGAFSKVDMESSTWDKEKGDIDGPFALAVQVDDDEGGKIIVNGCSNMITDTVDSAVNGANSDFVLNGINYLTKQESKISIRAKDLTSETVIVPEASQKMGMIFLVILIPLVILGSGIAVVVRRKKL